MNVVMFKNAVGQDLMAELIEEQINGDLRVRRPVAITMTGQMSNGVPELQLIPYFMFNPSDEMTMYKESLGTSPIPVNDGFVREYQLTVDPEPAEPLITE